LDYACATNQTATFTATAGSTYAWSTDGGANFGAYAATATSAQALNTATNATKKRVVRVMAANGCVVQREAVASLPVTPTITTAPAVTTIISGNTNSVTFASSAFAGGSGTVHATGYGYFSGADNNNAVTPGTYTWRAAASGAAALTIATAARVAGRTPTLWMATRDNKTCVSLPARANIIPQIPAGFTYAALSANHLESTTVDAWWAWSNNSKYSGNATQPSIANLRDGRTMQNNRIAGGWIKGQLFTHFDNLTYVATAWELGRTAAAVGCPAVTTVWTACPSWNNYTTGLMDGVSQNYRYMVTSTPAAVYGAASTNLQMFHCSQQPNSYNPTRFGYNNDKANSATYANQWATIATSATYNGSYNYWGATQDRHSLAMFLMIWRP
jgi:hypothetical protein